MAMARSVSLLHEIVAVFEGERYKGRMIASSTMKAELPTQIQLMI
jgi:hypothetical protein